MLHINGSCHCGYITYSADVDQEAVTVCHCTDCQILTGTAFRTTVPATRENFKLLSGKPTEYIKTTAESGNHRVQAFDLARDPDELQDCFDPLSPRDAALAELLEQYKARLVDGYRHRSSGELPDQEELEKLRSLGYAR